MKLETLHHSAELEKVSSIRLQSMKKGLIISLLFEKTSFELVRMLKIGRNLKIFAGALVPPLSLFLTGVPKTDV